MEKTGKTTGMRVCNVLLGLLFLAAGILFIKYPIRTEAFAGYIYICFFTASGIMQIITYFMNRKNGASGWVLALGILDVLLGGYFIFHVYAAVTLLPILLAFWAVCTGFMRILMALQAKGEEDGWGWKLFFGGLLLLIGILMFFNFASAALTIAMLLAIAMFVLSVQNFVEAFTK